MKKKAGELLQLARNALARAGANPVMAEVTAKHLLQAEAQGLPTHGLSRVPVYCAFLKNGRADGKARPKMVAERAGACLIDNCDGLPYETAGWAIAEIIHDIDLKDGKFEREEASGIATVLGGIVAAIDDDEQRIARASAIFDDLYAVFQRKRGAARAGRAPVKGGRR